MATPPLTPRCIDGITARKQDGVTGFFSKDLHGDVRYAFDSAGTEIANYVYDAWGDEQSSSASTWATNNPVRYNGQYIDEETGMYYLRARYYDPEVSRFISEDPIKDGLNWYAYAGNNPVMFVDPTGLESAITAIGGTIRDLVYEKVKYDNTYKDQNKEILSSGYAEDSDVGVVISNNYQSKRNNIHNQADKIRTSILSFDFSTINSSNGSAEILKAFITDVVGDDITGEVVNKEYMSTLIFVLYDYDRRLADKEPITYDHLFNTWSMNILPNTIYVPNDGKNKGIIMEYIEKFSVTWMGVYEYNNKRIVNVPIANQEIEDSTIENLDIGELD